MKTIYQKNAFDKKANGRTPLVRAFKDGIDEVAESAGGTIDEFKVEDGCFTLVIDNDKVADMIVSELKDMGFEPEVIGRKIDMFRTMYQQQKKSANV